MAGKTLILQYHYRIDNLIMAMAISNIPVLTGEVAERFIQMAKQAEKERGTIDFSKQREMFRKMMERSRRK